MILICCEIQESNKNKYIFLGGWLLAIYNTDRPLDSEFDAYSN